MGIIGFKQYGGTNMKERADYKTQQIGDLCARKTKETSRKSSKGGHQRENDQARPGNLSAKAGADKQGYQRKGGRELVQNNTDEQLLPAFLMLMVVGVEVFKITQWHTFQQGVEGEPDHNLYRKTAGLVLMGVHMPVFYTPAELLENKLGKKTAQYPEASIVPALLEHTGHQVQHCYPHDVGTAEGQGELKPLIIKSAVPEA
jgi:hypothetical protein